MGTVAGRRRQEKPRRVVPAAAPPDFSRPGWLVPPSGMPPPVSEVPQVLWGEARGRQVEPACDGVVVDVARKLLRVKPERWRKYREVVEEMRVPGLAGASPYFAAVVREWTPPDPWPPWRPPWLPAVLVALVGMVEAYRGEPWTVDMLRRYCQLAIRAATPARRGRGRPSQTTRWRAQEVALAWARTEDPIEGVTLWSRVAQLFEHLGNPVPDRTLITPDEKLRVSFLNRRLAAARAATADNSRGADDFHDIPSTRRRRIERRHATAKATEPASSHSALPRSPAPRRRTRRRDS